MVTVTRVVSVAVPEKDGVRLLVRAGGGFSVTVGASVSTTNFTCEVVNVLPAASVCVAATQ